MLSPIDISDAVNNALKNLSDSPTATIGQSIAEALSVVQTKIHYFSSKKKFQYQQDYIKFLNSAFAKISAIPIVDQTEPQAQILGAISEDITHCVGCEELREMFATLLSNSCNCKYSSIVHPSFSSSLRSMSPYDAMFLKRLMKGKKILIISMKLLKLPNTYCLDRLTLMKISDLEWHSLPTKILQYSMSALFLLTIISVTSICSLYRYLP